MTNRYAVFLIAGILLGCESDDSPSQSNSTAAESVVATPTPPISPNATPSPSPRPGASEPMRIDKLMVNGESIANNASVSWSEGVPMVVGVAWSGGSEETLPSVRAQWGDGSTNQVHCGPCKVEHTYEGRAAYQVIVDLYDGEGKRARPSLTISVSFTANIHPYIPEQEEPAPEQPSPTAAAPSPTATSTPYLSK